MTTIAYWALLVLSLAGVLAAGGAWVTGLRPQAARPGFRTAADLDEPAAPPPIDDATEAAARAAATFHGLTPRQREVLTFLAVGCSNEVIARALVVSPATAKFHVKNVLDRLQISRREVPRLVDGFRTD